MKIGLWARGGSAFWIAGSIYQENLIRSLRLCGEEVSVCLLTKGGKPIDQSSDLEDVEIVRAQAESSLVDRALARARKRLSFPDWGLRRAIRTAGIDVVFGNMGRSRLGTPWVGWISDFQFLKQAENFSPQERRHRRSAALNVIRKCDHLILSSQDAFGHLVELAPSYADKVSVAPFVSLFPDSYLDADPSATAKKFNLRSPYVVVPNQWWVHKNHGTVIEAASIVRRRGVDCQWLLTGTIFDSRNLQHYSALLQQIATSNVHENIVVLGFLPRLEQVQLMRAATAVVQPSLFEGWSTVVEDTKTLGQQLILSDIPIHREQDPPYSSYFDPRSSEELAERVLEVLSGRGPGRGDEAEALSSTRQRARAFGRTFSTACRKAARRR